MTRLLLLLMLSVTTAHAQTWEWLNPQPTGGASRDIAVTPDGTLLASGSLGTFIRSTDNGQTFEVRNVPTRASAAIGFVDGDTGWAGTGDGEIFATTNGGAAWSLQYQSDRFSFGDINAVDAQNAWAIGGDSFADRLVVRTVDGGQTWTQADYPRRAGAPFEGPFALNAFDAQTARVVDYTNTVYRTDDGGASWDSTHISVIPPSGFYDGAFFLDADRGWLVGSNTTIAFTADGGQTWTRQLGDPDSTSFARHAITEVHFVDANNGWAAASECLYRTSDGGDMWEQVCGTTGTTRKNKVLTTGPQSGYIVYQGSLLYSDDDGETFADLISGVKDRLNEASFVDETTAWVVGSGGTILRTDDGWDTYTVQTTPTTETLTGVEAADAQTAWAVGANGTILATADGGQTWAAQTSGVTTSLQDIALLGGASAVAVGNGQTVLRTTDGGVAWDPVPISLGDDDINALSFLDDGLRGWAVGDTGFVAVTFDGGQTWAAQTSGVLRNLTDVHFVDAQTGWAVGSSGTILATTDGGGTWTAQANPVAGSITRVFFLDDQTGWAIGFSDLLATTDGGQTWETDETTVAPLASGDVYAARPDLVWLFGRFGVIVRQGTPMLTSAESGAESGDARLAVFPNPTAGAATLALALDAPSEVTLLVHDALGRAVARQLVTLGAGEHRLALPVGLAPGMYVVAAEADGERLGTARLTVLR